MSHVQEVLAELAELREPIATLLARIDEGGEADIFELAEALDEVAMRTESLSLRVKFVAALG